MKFSHKSILDLLSLSLFFGCVSNELSSLVISKAFSHKDISVCLQLGENYIGYGLRILVGNSRNLALMKLLVSWTFDQRLDPSAITVTWIPRDYSRCSNNGYYYYMLLPVRSIFIK